MISSRTRKGIAIALLGCAALVGCTLSGTPGGIAATITIANRTFTFELNLAGIFRVTAGTPARNAAVVPLFDGTPEQTPGSGTVNLDTARVRAIPLDTGKGTVNAQTVDGSANVTVFIGAGSSTDPCDDGINIGAFGVTFTAGAVSLDRTSLDLASGSLDLVLAGTFTICMEVTATVDIELTIEELSCTFGPPVHDDDDGTDGGTDDGTDDGTDGGTDDGTDGGTDGGTDDGTDGGTDDGTGDTDDDTTPPPTGFSPAIILHRGSEQVVAGPNVDPAQSLVYASNLTVSDIALSGDGTMVWFSLYDDFPLEGEAAFELWVVGTDGSGGQQSALNLTDVEGALTLATNLDGSVVIADSGFNETSILRASPGAAATLVFNSTTLGVGGCSRGVTRLTDSGSALYYRDYCGKNFYRVDLSGGDVTPTLIFNAATIVNANGFTARGIDEFDITSDGGQWIIESEILDSSLNNTLFLNLVHSSGLTTPTTFEPTPSDTLGIRDVHMTDDGSAYGYCQDPSSLGEVAPCYVQAPGSSARFAITDERTALGEFVLSDDGTTVYARTNYQFGPSSGHGLLQHIASTAHITPGSQRFSGTATPEFWDVHLSEDGSVLAAPNALGVYVLHDGVDGLPGFPIIEDLYYGYEGDTTLKVRLVITPPASGIERVFVLPFYKGLDATLEVPFEENPFYNDRSGGGVNWSTTFTEVEGQSNTWERSIDLCDGSGNCKRSFITSDYTLRVIVVDGNGTRSAFQDFTPLP